MSKEATHRRIFGRSRTEVSCSQKPRQKSRFGDLFAARDLVFSECMLEGCGAQPEQTNLEAYSAKGAVRKNRSLACLRSH